MHITDGAEGNARVRGRGGEARGARREGARDATGVHVAGSGHSDPQEGREAAERPQVVADNNWRERE